MGILSSLKEASLTRKIGIVFAVALLARIVVLAWLLATGGEQQIVFGDTTRYLTLADNVLSGVGFMYDGILETFRLPGYPAFLMLLRILHLPLVAGSLIQIVIASCFAVWALWFARVRLQLSQRVSFFVGLVVAIEPIQVYYSVVLLPDVLFTAGFLVAFTYALKWTDSGRIRDAVIAAIAIGVADYFRPALIYYPIFLALGFIAFAVMRKTNVKKAAIASAVVGVISFAIMAPWYVRNQVQFGHFALMSMKEYTLYVYGAASIDAAARGVSYETSKQALLAKARAEAPNPNIATFDNGPYYAARAKEIILVHPVIFVKLYALGLTSFWTAGNYQYLFKDMGLLAPPSQSISYTMLLGSQGPVVAAKTFLSKITEPFILTALFDRLFWASVFALSLAGLYRYRRSAVAWLTLITYAYFSATILSTVIGVEARHRYALIPIMIAFAVAGAVAAYKRFSRTISDA